MLVGPQPALGAQVAGDDLDRVERRPVQRGQVGVGQPRVAVVAVVGRVAAAEVLVLARRGELVEPGHGLDQAVGVHPCRQSQPGQAVLPDHRPGGVPAARQRPVRRQPGEHVPVAVALVEDQPGRDVRVLRRVPVVHGVHRVDVRRRLVDEPLAGAVDHDAAGQVALGQAEVRAAGQRDGRPPPGVVHQPGVRARASSPARIPSPVFPGAPVVHPIPIGSCWYWRRISSLRSKPPLASSTPRRARISTGSPSRVARDPGHPCPRTGRRSPPGRSARYPARPARPPVPARPAAPRPAPAPGRASAGRAAGPGSARAATRAATRMPRG